MEKLPDCLLLQILSRLDDTADVARCRVASKPFNTVFAGLRSIYLRRTQKWYADSRSGASSSERIKPFKTVFLDLISKLETVESVCIALHDTFIFRYWPDSDHSSLMEEDFVIKWLPRVSNSLKSLSISDASMEFTSSNILALIFEYCHNLVNLKLKRGVSLSMQNLNTMPMLTSLTLDSTILEDENLNELNKCFPNLQVLELIYVSGLQDPKLHLFNLKTCVWNVDYYYRGSVTLITPNLITLSIEWSSTTSILIEAPMLSYMRFNNVSHSGTFTFTNIDNLKTLWLQSYKIGYLLSEFPITKTIETLTLDSVDPEDEDWVVDASNPIFKFTLGNVFTVFPNVTSLCIKSGAWLDFEAWFNPQGSEVLYGSQGLKIFCAYLMSVDLSLTFSYVAYVLDQCVGLSEISLLIHSDVVGAESKSFISKCMARWPVLKWRWGTWTKDKEDSWIIDGSSN